MFPTLVQSGDRAEYFGYPVSIRSDGRLLQVSFDAGILDARSHDLQTRTFEWPWRVTVGVRPADMPLSMVVF
jgi:hypothetical protein